MAEASEAPLGGDADADADNHPRKRLRISRACDTCRRRKERCDGTEPSCRRCNDSGRACSYYPSRRRGLPPGYVRSLEILLGLLFYSFPESSALIRSIIHGEPCTTALKLASPVESLLETWRESTALEQLQRALASAPPAGEDDIYLQDLNRKWTSRFNDLPRGQTQTESIDRNFASDGTGHCLPDLTQRQPFPLPRVIQLPSPTALLPVETTSLVLPDDWQRLVNSYLVNTHSWLPIVQKFTLFRCANMVSHSGISGGVVDMASGDVSSLWAVLALGSYQSDLPGAQTVSSRLPSTDVEHRTPLSAHLYATAKSLLPHDQTGFQPGHVHASLVLALREIASGSWTDAWLFICRAAFMASSIGIVPQLGHDSHTPMTDAEKRLFMGCFVLDGIVASALSVRPNLHKEDLSRVGGISVDGLEEWEPWGPDWGLSLNSESSIDPGRLLSTFNYLTDLICLLKTYDQSTGSPELRNKLIQEFMDWQKKIPFSNDPVFSTTRSTDNDITGTTVQNQTPPHILHLNILAGTFYVMLGSSTLHTNPDRLYLNALRLTTTSPLPKILRSMQTISKKTSLPILGRYIPTLLSTVKLLGRDPALTSSEFLLPPGYLNENGLHQQFTQIPLTSSTTPAPENQDQGREGETRSPRIRNLNTVLTTGLEEPSSSADMGAAHSAPVLTTDCVNPQTNLSGPAEVAAVGSIGHDDSFEQLNILEMANWYVRLI